MFYLLITFYEHIKRGGYLINEEATMVDTETSEDITTTTNKYNIEKQALKDLNALCRINRYS